MKRANRPASGSVYPDPRGAGIFFFTRAEYDPLTGVARLGYRFDDGPELIERITFPDAPKLEDSVREAAFRRALALLHAVAGVSYYKAGLSPELRLASAAWPGFIGFLTELYVNGLAEFGHVNGLDVAARVNFTTSNTEASAAGEAIALDLPDRALVAMGGGKDSLVGLDLLRVAGVDVLPISVGESALISRTVRVAGLPLLQIRRELAPELSEMNRAGAWNGHVPVTAINSAIVICAGLLYGYRLIVFANERSADEATLFAADGRQINHQYSKSSGFEAGLRALLEESVSADIEYFSILRPFSELGVVERFARLEPFHSAFSSCNRNFHIDGPRVAGRWCRDCPKCRFAALSLALFLPPNAVAAIQGGDILDDLSQLSGFRALCRLGRDKPFECVGEAGESRAALLALGDRPDWRRHAVVQALQPLLAEVDVPPMAELLEPSARHFIPDALSERLGLPRAQHAGR